MEHTSNWDWEIGDRLVAEIGQWENDFEAIHDFAVSHDGEKIAAVVKDPESDLKVCVNGETWEHAYEKMWSLRFCPDGRLVVICMADDEWTVCVDGVPWDKTFEFVWNLQLARENGKIAVQVKGDEGYGVCIDGEAWEAGFTHMRTYAPSPDGTRAAGAIQVKDLAEADIFGYLEGIWSVAVDGIPWDRNFLNVWGLAFGRDNRRVAAEVRLDRTTYTIAVDGKPWDAVYSCVWEPCFSTRGKVVAPVKTPTGWTLAEDGRQMWDATFVQLWQPIFARNPEHTAAIVATKFGKWTVAVNGKAWRKTFSDAVCSHCMTPDGAHVAAVVKNKGRWGICVDGKPWSETFDMVWAPRFSPDGSRVIAKAERNGKFFLVLDGKVGKQTHDGLWEPEFSPDGSKVLVKRMKDSRYYRSVVSLDKI